MKKLIFALCMVVVFSTSANIYAFTGNQLVENWRAYKKFKDGNEKANPATGAYLGYVNGIADATNGVLFSGPPNVTWNQIASVVGKWLDNHPEELNKEAAELVINALQSAFPLKKK